MAVRIRLKKMGRAHRPFYRVCAFDHHAPRDGRALEELGTYDTSLVDTDARAVLNQERIDYWLSVGAQPTEKVAILIKKYGTDGTHLEQQKSALEALAAPWVVPDPGAPASMPKKPEEEKPAEEAVAAEAPAAEAASPEAPAEGAPAAEATKAEAPATEAPASEAKAETPAAEAATEKAPAAEEKAPKAEEADKKE